LLYRYKTQHFKSQDYISYAQPALSRLTPVAA